MGESVSATLSVAAGRQLGEDAADVVLVDDADPFDELDAGDSDVAAFDVADFDVSALVDDSPVLDAEDGAPDSDAELLDDFDEPPRLSVL